MLPGSHFPLLAAEDLAARYLEKQPTFTSSKNLSPSESPDLWQVLSPGGRAVGLFSTSGLRTRMETAAREATRPAGIQIRALSPREEVPAEGVLLTAALSPQLPGWRLALSLDDRARLDSAAEQKVGAYLWIGSAMIAAMAVLATFIARGFGRQIQLARLKNDLVATVSHELKTPLTAMRALVDTLLETETFEEKTTRDYLQLLARENLRLSRLIDHFLTFSRLEQNKFRFSFSPIRPETLIAAALEAMGERRHAAGCHLETQIAQNLPSVVGDPDALITALLNLLDNAWKYSGAEKRIQLRVHGAAGEVHFAVEDNGIGLAKGESGRIFRRFYQSETRLSRTTDGCGLGLSIVQSIVEAHRGTLAVQSQEGRGSIFSITLPALQETHR